MFDDLAEKSEVAPMVIRHDPGTLVVVSPAVALKLSPHLELDKVTADPCCASACPFTAMLHVHAIDDGYEVEYGFCWLHVCAVVKALETSGSDIRLTPAAVELNLWAN